MEGEHVRLLAEDDPILEDGTAQVLPRSVRDFMRRETRPGRERPPAGSLSGQRKQDADNAS